MTHALITCPWNNGVGISAFNCVSDHRIEAKQALQLQFDMEGHLELPVVWVWAVSWSYIWETRTVAKKPELYKIRADLEARVSFLRETRRHKGTAISIASMINNLHNNGC